MPYELISKLNGYKSLLSEHIIKRNLPKDPDNENDNASPVTLVLHTPLFFTRLAISPITWRRLLMSSASFAHYTHNVPRLCTQHFSQIIIFDILMPRWSSLEAVRLLPKVPGGKTMLPKLNQLIVTLRRPCGDYHRLFCFGTNFGVHLGSNGLSTLIPLSLSPELQESKLLSTVRPVPLL